MEDKDLVSWLHGWICLEK